jgi:hypothetical protein
MVNDSISMAIETVSSIGAAVDAYNKLVSEMDRVALRDVIQVYCAHEIADIAAVIGDGGSL